MVLGPEVGSPKAVAYIRAYALAVDECRLEARQRLLSLPDRILLNAINETRTFSQPISKYFGLFVFEGDVTELRPAQTRGLTTQLSSWFPFASAGIFDLNRIYRIERQDFGHVFEDTINNDGYIVYRRLVIFANRKR